MKLVLVTRQGCHLCDEALALLKELGYEPKLADVDADDRLHDLYDWRVPVILLDGRVIAEGKIKREHLIQALQSSPRKHSLDLHAGRIAAAPRSLSRRNRGRRPGSNP